MSLLPHNGLISLSYKWQVSSASPTRISAFSTEVRSRVIHRPCQKFAIELFFLDFFVSSAMLKLCPMFLSRSPLEEGCFSLQSGWTKTLEQLRIFNWNLGSLSKTFTEIFDILEYLYFTNIQFLNGTLICVSNIV